MNKKDFLGSLLRRPRQPFLTGGLLATAILALDQLAKGLIVYAVNLPDRGVIRLTGFFNLRMAWNPGISFGLFPADSTLGRYGLVVFAVAVVVFLLIWLRKAANLLTTIAIGMIVGGAIGNVLDRIFYGAVVDFLDFHLLGYHFYTFNVADAAISIGVALLVVEALLGSKPGEKTAFRQTTGESKPEE